MRELLCWNVCLGHRHGSLHQLHLRDVLRGDRRTGVQYLHELCGGQLRAEHRDFVMYHMCVWQLLGCWHELMHFVRLWGVRIGRGRDELHFLLCWFLLHSDWGRRFDHLRELPRRQLRWNVGLNFVRHLRCGVLLCCRRWCMHALRGGDLSASGWGVHLHMSQKFRGVCKCGERW